VTLQIAKAEFCLARIPLRFSIQHALASRSVNTSGFVILSAIDGTLGIGEFLCREYVTGERPEHCLRYLQTAIPLLTNARIENPLDFMRSLWLQATNEAGKYGAMCAVELALLDLWGKQEGKPVAELLRPGVLKTAPDPIYSAVYPFASGLKLAALHVFYRAVIQPEWIKVKGRGCFADDLDYILRIRRAFAYPVQVRLDLNGALAAGHADEYFSRMIESPQGVRWFEQPFRKDAWELSEQFQRKLGHEAVLCADESVCTLDDLAQAIQRGAFRAVNIRIAKHGGLMNSLKLYEQALGAGLQVQLGCLVGESSVLAYAGLHFAALANQLQHREGCFGTRLIKWDVIDPSLKFSRNGRVPLARLPRAGLVPAFDANRLRRQAFQSGSIRGVP
jgi:L-Ala-D/L-Glu epimerase